MRKISVFLAVLAVIIAACNNQAGYEITGALENYPEGTVYLGKMDGFKLVYVDSTDIREGKFSFSGAPVSTVETYYLQAKGVRLSHPFFLENGKIAANGNIEKSDFYITGTPNNDALTAYNDAYRALFPQGRMAAIPAGGGRSNDTLQQKINALLDEYVEKYDDKEIAAYLLAPKANGYDITAGQIDSLVALLSPALSESVYVQTMKKGAQRLRAIEPGNPAPEISLPGQNGEKIALSSLKGKYVYIDFWASWCGPCRAEAPHLVKTYETYRSKGFEIYGVSIDEKPEAWEKAIATLKLPWVHVIDTNGWNSPVVAEYAIRGIPTTMLLDREGKIIARNLRGEALNEKLKEIFATQVVVPRR